MSKGERAKHRHDYSADATGAEDQGGESDRILVLDAHKNASVVVARTLADENVEVTVGGWSRFSPAMLSRVVEDRFHYPSPYQYPRRFLTELEIHLERNDYLAVVPISDLSHVLLAKHKDRLEATGTAVGVEGWERFVAANNKKSLAALLEDLSVPTPHTRGPESATEAAALRDEFSYPVLIKPQYTTIEKEDGTYAEARISEENYVYDPENLAERYRDLVEKYPYFRSDPPIVQEVVSGTVAATCGVAEDGEFLEYFQEERLRMFPVDGGSSSLRQGIRCPEMAENARRVVSALGWTGPIYIEFIHSPDGDCYVLEVNGRYWGSVGCAIHGGVNVPQLHYRQLKGIDQSPSQRYEIGRQQRRLFYTDIRWLTAQLEDGNVGALWPFCRSFLEADHDLLSVDDPLPVAGAVFWGLQEVLRGRGPTETLSKQMPDIATRVSGMLQEARK
jgi:predicted ATP-grasp superfamily ATP-dependent carboligase